MPTRFDLNQERAFPLYYGFTWWNSKSVLFTLSSFRILLSLPAMLGARLVGYDLLDFGSLGTPVVFVFISEDGAGR